MVVTWSKESAATCSREKINLKPCGLQMAKNKNFTLLAKLNWRFHSEPEATWVVVLKRKYCSHRRIASRDLDKLLCSQV